MPALRSLLSTLALAGAASGITGCFFLMPPPQQQPADPNDPTYQAAVASGERSQLEGAQGEPGGGMDSPAPGGSQGVAPGEPSPSRSVPTTVEVRSECSKTVPVFYGDKPKFGSGTKSSVSSNSISSAGRKSDGTLTVWIIDDSENGISSARVTPETRRVVIDRSCTSVRAE